jgi:hypothetical protein
VLVGFGTEVSWIDDVASGRIRSLAEIAECEGKVERPRRPTKRAWPPLWKQKPLSIIDGIRRLRAPQTPG